MKVTLISHTQDALDLLLLTKSTRLLDNPDKALIRIQELSEAEKLEELNYIKHTIQSSWEFIDYIFIIQDVSRAFTHQFVRHRHGSYAQQSQRTVKIEDFNFLPLIGEDISYYAEELYQSSMLKQFDIYQKLTSLGIPLESARGVLPTAVYTNIIAKFNLRSLSEMAKVRLCTRTQGEHQEVFRRMRNEVISVHPWADDFLRVHCAATGTCCFPKHEGCPIKPGIFNPDTGGIFHAPGTNIEPFERPLTKNAIQEKWEKLCEV
jgi:flavin-dependent thymidylate synthase